MGYITVLSAGSQCAAATAASREGKEALRILWQKSAKSPMFAPTSRMSPCPGLSSMPDFAQGRSEDFVVARTQRNTHTHTSCHPYLPCWRYSWRTKISSYSNAHSSNEMYSTCPQLHGQKKIHKTMCIRAPGTVEAKRGIAKRGSSRECNWSKMRTCRDL
jgi:hypothetical protein